MPRRLLRDGRVVVDDWTYVKDLPDAARAANAAAAPASPLTSVIVTLAQWLADPQKWRAHRVGLVLEPAHKVEHLAPHLLNLALIACEFPGPSDGRGYTQGRLLRERHQFSGELRASGYVRRDQLFFLARCGFNSFELPAADLDDATVAFATFSAEYQPSNDLGLALKPAHRAYT